MSIADKYLIHYSQTIIPQFLIIATHLDSDFKGKEKDFLTEETLNYFNKIFVLEILKLKSKNHLDLNKKIKDIKRKSQDVENLNEIIKKSYHKAKKKFLNKKINKDT